MRYISTRGLAPPVSFLDAVLGGLAPDGGLYVPETWPRLGEDVLAAAATAPYAETAAQVLHAFAGDDLTLTQCRAMAQDAYGDQWANAAICPLRQIGPGEWLLELFHGPSLAFKDVAMQLLAPLFDHALAARDARLTVVCATSGDTGGAAVEALRRSSRVDLFVLLPKGRVSDVQRRFMTASGAANVFAIEVDGDFDAAQGVVKALFADRDFASEVALSPVNSINWARVLAQAAYYVTSAASLAAAGPVRFTVPTGNFGDALAGDVARRLGAPIGEIRLATNANDSLTTALETGVFAAPSHSAATISPAMDVTAASNFERIVFEAVGRDAETLRGLYAAFAQGRRFEIPAPALAALRAGFSGARADDAATRAAMIEAKALTGEVLCPHTAVGWSGRLRCGTGARVLLATAHPAKFPETVEAVLGAPPAPPPAAIAVMGRAEVATDLPAEPGAVKAFIRAHSRAAA
jgi:threonine synthase